jgi:hypothetical protein
MSIHGAEETEVEVDSVPTATGSASWAEIDLATIRQTVCV